jgi:hypothetical protein
MSRFAKLPGPFNLPKPVRILAKGFLPRKVSGKARYIQKTLQITVREKRWLYMRGIGGA